VHSEFVRLLRREVGSFLELTDQQTLALETHWQTLVHWNRRLNLTAVRTTQEAIRKHYGESLFLAAQLHNVVHESILDVGSGAGFPGYPLAVVFPASTVVLAESHQRKAVFLREVTREVPNVGVEATRIEDLGGSYDVAVSRAVAWSDIRQSVSRLALAVALLVSDEDAGEIVNDSAFSWRPAEQLPWPNSGVLLIGSKT
jgi:16S rRNA (guanine527-N7)-methyltransferase